MASDDPKIRSIGQISVRANDLARAIAFYRDKLSLPFLFQAPPAMAFFRCGDTMLLVGTPESARFDHPSSILYFLVEDIEESHRILAARGVVFDVRPHLVHEAPDFDLWLAFFGDSEGNTHALMCRKAKA